LILAIGKIRPSRRAVDGTTPSLSHRALIEAPTELL